MTFHSIGDARTHESAGARRTRLCKMRRQKRIARYKRDCGRFGERIIKDRIFAVISALAKKKNLSRDIGGEIKRRFVQKRVSACAGKYTRVYIPQWISTCSRMSLIEEIPPGESRGFYFSNPQDFTTWKELTRGLLGSYLFRTRKIGLPKWPFFRRNPPEP